MDWIMCPPKYICWNFHPQCDTLEISKKEEIYGSGLKVCLIIIKENVSNNVTWMQRVYRFDIITYNQILGVSLHLCKTNRGVKC